MSSPITQNEFDTYIQMSHELKSSHSEKTRYYVLKGKIQFQDLRHLNLPDYTPVVKDLDETILDIVLNEENSLNMRHWHSPCGTAHCIAGWAIHLAGEKGYQLEALVGPAIAGAMIYAKSHPDRELPNFNEWWKDVALVGLKERCGKGKDHNDG